MKIRKMLICLVLAVAMVTGAGVLQVSAAGNVSAAAQAYINVLNTSSVYDFSPVSNAANRTVAVMDINQDGVPELLFPAYTATGSSMYPTYSVDMQVWTYVNGKAVKAGSIYKEDYVGVAGYHPYLYRMKDGSLCCEEKYGDEYISKIVFTWYSCNASGSLITKKQYSYTMKPYNLYSDNATFDISLNGVLQKSGVKGINLVNEIESMAGLSGNISAMVSQLYGVPSNSPYKYEGMTKAEAIAYLKTLGSSSSESGSGTWKKGSNGWWYQYPDGSYPAGKWAKIDGKWYYFNSKGFMQTGWMKNGGKWYYLGTGGAMVTGWKKVSGKWYYLGTDGVMATGWQKISGKWYYLNASGEMQTGWMKSGGKWYYLGTGGAMVTGWVKSGSKWYYLGSSGALQTGWVKSGGYWYYLNPSTGAMVTGWKKISGYWYYLDPATGAMVTGTCTINGKTYLFDSDGVCLGETSSSAGWKTGYRDFLLNNDNLRQELGRGWIDSIWLFDLNRDSIPELFIEAHDVSAASFWDSVFTWNNGSVINLGAGGSGADSYYANEGYSGLFTSNIEGMNGYSYSYLSLSNGTLSRTVFLESVYGSETVRNNELYQAYQSAYGMDFSFITTLDEIQSMGWDTFLEYSGF